MIEFKMPSLGADMEMGTLTEWYKKPGDIVKRGDIIANVDTQKGSIDIEIFEDGIIEKLLIQEGEKVPVGTVMALISGTSSTSEIISPEGEKREEKTHKPKITPLAKKIAEENNIDYENLKGSGENDAITREDIEKIVAAKKIKTEIKPTTSIRMAIAAAMSKSNAEIPHYYLETKIDMSNTLDWLKEKNKKLPVRERILPIAMLIKATAKALEKFPELNAIWSDGLVKKEKINIGIVISLGNGIIIPAVQEANKKTTEEVMHNMNDIIQRARNMKLRSSELSDSTITITSLGDNGVETVFGVIYPPQVALLGFGSITNEPWVENGMLGVRAVVHATLAADHRATDGHTGGRFLQEIRSLLSNPESL